MKKIFSLIAVLILLCGCDDGDMTFKTFDFSTASANSCTVDNGLLYYKINGSEVLVLELAEGVLTNSPNLINGKNEPREILITGNNKITYINYASAPTSSTFCTRFAAGTTDSDDRWIGTGTISVITTAKLNDKLKITGYDHQVTLKNTTFTKGGESITINNNFFGTITILNGFTFDFLGTDITIPPVINRCENNDLLYTNKNQSLLVAELSSLEDYFPSAAGETSVPLNNISERVLFTMFDVTVRPDRICQPGGTGVVGNPINNQRWTSLSGTMVIKTVAEPGAGNLFKSTVYLKDVIFSNILNPTVTFSLNEVVEVTTDGYLFGTYIH